MTATDDQPIATWVHGATGRMGSILQECIADHPNDFRLIGGSGHNFIDSGLHKDDSIDPKFLARELKHCGLVIDFSSFEGNDMLCQAIKDCERPPSSVLIATTGLSTKQQDAWKKLAGEKKIRLLFARNTSLGVTLLIQSALQLFGVLKDKNFDVEIHEAHHRNKVDAPSGTALMIGDSLIDADASYKMSTSHEGGRQDKTIGMSVTRGGQIFGEHTVSFLGEDEEIRISHRALNRRLFAKGALALSQWLAKQKPGVYYVEDIKDPS